MICQHRLKLLLHHLSITAMILFAFCNSAYANGDYTPEIIDINKADTTVWISLPGIGSKLASRIVNYRQQLHGFSSVDQVGETYGLADSTFQKIKHKLVVSDLAVEKININTAGVEELKMPYISYNVANAIYQYRLQHGSFKKLEDLRKIMLIDGALYTRIANYFTID